MILVFSSLLLITLPRDTTSLCHQNVFFDAYADDRGTLFSSLADQPFHPHCSAISTDCIPSDIELGSNWRISTRPPYQIRLFCGAEQFITADGIAYWFIDNGLNLTYLSNQLFHGDKNNTFRPQHCNQQILIEHVPCGSDAYLSNFCVNNTHCVTIQDYFDYSADHDETTSVSLNFQVNLERLVCIGLFVAIIISIIVAIETDGKKKALVEDLETDDEEIEQAVAKIETSQAHFDEQKCEIYLTQGKPTLQEISIPPNENLKSEV